MLGSVPSRLGLRVHPGAGRPRFFRDMDAVGFVKQRAWFGGIAAFLGALVHLWGPAPPPTSLEGLAAMLGESVAGVVEPRDIAWERSPGFWAETFVGRRVLFLGAAAKGGPRDLYRAQVRVTLSGKPVAVERVHNVTETPLGDDVGLEVRDGKAAIATLAYGRIQGISVLEVEGIRREDQPSSWFDRALLAITSWQKTGTFHGIGRTDIVLEVPVSQARLTFSAPWLRAELPGGGSRDLTFNVETRDLAATEGGQPYGARAIVQQHQPKPFILWAVDTVREEVGPAPVAWLENVVFGARDTFRRNTYSLFAHSDTAVLKGEGQRQSALDASELAECADSWPPPSLPSLWQKLEPGEGEWAPVTDSFLIHPVSTKGLRPIPYFYQTFIRPDVKRPYSKLWLIAMDMRQLELGMEAGFEDPQPLVGPPGTGRLPREPALWGRVVGTFNGAFKSDHGEFGMMVNRRVLLPPVPGGASVVVTDQGQVGMGNWPQGETIPNDIVSFRQNLDPLVEDGVVNPTGRYVWGWQLAGTSVMTQRTALCVTPAGHLYYAFGEEIDAPTLSRGLRQAGCSYAMHLDMNPKHCGFVFTRVGDLRQKQFDLRLAHPQMQINPDRFVNWSAKDFFYVMVRDPRPPSVDGLRWEVDPGEHPPPQAIPAVFRGTLKLGNLEVHLTTFDSTRLEWRIRAGSKEPAALDAPPHKLALSGSDSHRVIAAIGLGHTTNEHSYGLAFGAVPTIPLRPGAASLVLSPTEPPRVHSPDSPPSVGPAQEAVQLPLLADQGELLERAREPGPLRNHGGLCVLPSGLVIVARSRYDSSAPVATALLRLGCKQVLELERGSQHPAFVHRTGTDTPPVQGYEASVLYALGRPMKPGAFRWKPPGSRPASKPTGKEPVPPRKDQVQGQPDPVLARTPGR